MRIAAIDQGTTSTRCLVFQDGGHWHVADSRAHQQYHPAAGWVEHDPLELLENVRRVLENAGPVDGIALANQGESCLAWHAVTREPLSRVIVWQDARTSTQLAALSPEQEAQSQAICGLPLDPYFSASKLSWLLHNIPAVAKAHADGHLKLGTTDAFLIDNLTGRFVTDIATASRTGLLDLANGQWSKELCKLHVVPIECLPLVVAIDSEFGMVGDTPLLVSLVDQQAALYGHDCRKPGDCKITFGTGAFLLAVTGADRPNAGKLLPTVAWQRMGEGVTYAVEAGVYDAGAAIEWARLTGLFSDLAELDMFAGATAINRGIVFVPALSGLGAPYWDRNAAALFLGMDHATCRHDLVRAVLEGIAMSIASLIDAASAIVALGDVVSIDGGLSQSTYFASFLASACGKRVRVPPMHELTALGLADLCGVDVDAARTGGAVFAPDGLVTNHDHARFADAVQRARGWRS